MPEPVRQEKLAVLILAAGKGTRMKNPQMAKVMNTINRKPMVEYVIDLAGRLRADRIILIVGWQKNNVIGHFSGSPYRVEFVEQSLQLGTGHAVLQAMEPLQDFSGDLLVLSGDVPLLTEKTVKAFIGYHRTSGAAATILTAEVESPEGYGRIIHNEDGSVKKIVEHKDASADELKITEINSGIYLFNKEKLYECLPKITANNVQKEYYLTDVFESFWKNDWKVTAVKVIDTIEVVGINDFGQLQKVRKIMASQTSR